MQNRLRMLMGATALLYAGPFVAGLGGFGWAVAPVFAAIFLLWLFILHPQQWPSKPADWARPEALISLLTQGLVQLLLVALLFGVGRGIGGVLATLPPFSVVLPLSISFLSIPFARMIWDPRHDRDIDRFLDHAIALVDAHPGAPDVAGLDMARSLIAALAELPDDADETLVAQHLLALATHTGPDHIRKALLERQHSGAASHAETIALILHATDGRLIESVGGDGPTLALAVLPRDPALIALFASRLTAALNVDADLWGQCPSVDLLEDLVLSLEKTAAEMPLRNLIEATNRAQPADGLA
jgi:hypothetical protein